MDDGACSGSWVCNRANHRCRPPANESCEYGLAACLGTGYCSNACSTDADCPSADYQCQGVPSTYNNFNTGDVSDDAVGIIHYCVYAPGSRSTCTAENDCTAENESCLIGRDAVGAVSTFCSSANSSALGADGDACGAVGTEPVLCKTGFCDYLDGDTLGPDNSDDPRQGKCTHLCSTDEDCGTDRDCVDFSFGPTFPTASKSAADGDAPASRHKQSMARAQGCLPPLGIRERLRSRASLRESYCPRMDAPVRGTFRRRLPP